MEANVKTQLKKFLEDTELFVLDMDGTFFLEQDVIDGALDFINTVNRKGKKFMFFTNNSSKAPEDYMEKLEKAGCPVSRRQIMTSGDVSICYLKRNYPSASVYLAGTPQFEKSVREAGIRLTEQEPDIVLISFDMTLTYDKLMRCCSFIRQGSLFLATHPDINCPVKAGFIPDCGAICAAVSLSTGREPKYLGKPYRETVEMIADQMHTATAKIAFVGDRLYTDIAAGVEHGGMGFLVLTGEATAEDVKASKIKPTAVYQSLGEMADYMNGA